MADLQGTFEFVGLNGHVLTVAEETALSASLLLLSQERGTPFRFWGKVFGYKGDYLLAQAAPVPSPIPVSKLSERITVYSTDGGHHWTDLEALTEGQVVFCDQLRGAFIGDPSFEYRVLEDVPEVPEEPPPPPQQEDQRHEEEEEKEEEEEEDKGEEEEEAKQEQEEEAAEEEAAPSPPKKKKKRKIMVTLKEAARLAHFVQLHDYTCQVAPHSMYMLVGEGLSNITPNKTFQGLDHLKADKLESYLHLRRPHNEDLPVKSSPHYNQVLDFLVPISMDIPEGIWSLQYDACLGVVVGKNLLYQGSVFYHKPGSKLFGQYYIGDGQRNVDLCFLLPARR